MNREEHLKFCKTCVNRKPNMEVGLLCSLTDKIADFENECISYTIDKESVAEIDNVEAVEHSDVLEKLSAENKLLFKSQQNLSKAILLSLIVGVLGGVLWGIITVVTNFQIGYMAIAIGAGVGFSMRYFGKGIDQIFGISGAIISVLSCVLGNLLSIIGYVANSENLNYIDTLLMFNYGETFNILSLSFNPMDIVFYGIAAYEGYKFSFRVFTEKDLYELEGK